MVLYNEKVPVTLTRKLQVPVFPAVSVAEQLTSVFPTKNVSLDVREQVTVTSPSTLSCAVGSIATCDEKFRPTSVVDVLFVQLRNGTSSSVSKRTQYSKENS